MDHFQMNKHIVAEFLLAPDFPVCCQVSPSLHRPFWFCVQIAAVNIQPLFSFIKRRECHTRCTEICHREND